MQNSSIVKTLVTHFRKLITSEYAPRQRSALVHWYKTSWSFILSCAAMSGAVARAGQWWHPPESSADPARRTTDLC